jgi:hypothetical protein
VQTNGPWALLCRARVAERRRTAGSGQRRVVPERPTVPAAEGLGGFRSRQGASRQKGRPALPLLGLPKLPPTSTPLNQQAELVGVLLASLAAHQLR